MSKPKSEAQKRANARYYKAHRKELIQKSIRWNKKNKKRHDLHKRKVHLKYIGWTLEAYESAERTQSGLCAICKRPNNQKRRPLHADHDHITGKSRELLCSGCNTGIGSFRDNPELLEVAAAYLRKHGK